MKIEILTTGDELMSGLTRDGNFQWAGQMLTGLGFNIAYHTTVGDDKEVLSSAFNNAKNRADAVIVTGGLGPTPDDLTIEVAAEFFGVELEFNQDALDMMTERFEKIGRKVSKTNMKQVYLPKGSRVLLNKWGTAPGFSSDIESTVFYFLPGVPKEFRAMMDEYVIPDLKHRNPGMKKSSMRLVKTFGLPESEVAQKLEGIERDGIRLGYRAHFREIHLRVSSFADTVSETESLMEDFLNDVHLRLGYHVFTTNGEMLEEVVGNMLKEKSLTISTAESCTGGLLSDRITNIPGSSSYFLEGVVSYSNEAKAKILGVPTELIESNGAVSAPVVQAMAKGVRSLSGSDIGIGISGIAGPGGGSEEKPVGTVFIGFDSDKTGSVAREFHFHGTREEIKLITVLNALYLIRKNLLNNV
ncbi:MAG: competence/damage-inducible protein A [Thermodesulfobacteriota bacterium]